MVSFHLDEWQLDEDRKTSEQTSSDGWIPNRRIVYVIV